MDSTADTIPKAQTKAQIEVKLIVNTLLGSSSQGQVMAFYSFDSHRNPSPTVLLVALLRPSRHQLWTRYNMHMALLIMRLNCMRPAGVPSRCHLADISL